MTLIGIKLSSWIPLRARGWRLLCVLALFLFSAASLDQSSVQADRQNELRLAGPVQGPETLDPAQMRDLSTVTILRQIYRGLVYYDDALNPVPELAESYEVSDDGLTYTFQLRPGATFHNGDPITADDVAFSLSRAVNPDSVDGDRSLLSGPAFLSDIVGFGEVYSGDSDLLSGIVVIADDALSITLAAPRSTFLMKLASVPATIVDRAQVESDPSWWVHPNGSGPYAVESWEPGEELSLVRYNGFALVTPHIDTINVRLGARSLQPFNLYQSDQVDVAAVSIYDVDRVSDPNGLFVDQLVRTPQFGFGYISFRTDVAPFDDPKIREALQRAFPRYDMASIMFNGLVNTATGLIPDGMLGEDWDSVVPEADFDAARRAITESSYGSPDNVPSIRIYASGSLASDLLRHVAEEELGLTIEVFDLQWYDFLDRLDSAPIPAFELYWAADYPDPEAILLALWGSDQPNNYTGYSNPEVDRILAEAAAEPDPPIRAEMYADAQRLILADNVVIPAYMDVDYQVVKPYVKNLTITPIGILRLETASIEQ
jgi:ABC-type transport system substrate-binding protein